MSKKKKLKKDKPRHRRAKISGYCQYDDDCERTFEALKELAKDLNISQDDLEMLNEQFQQAGIANADPLLVKAVNAYTEAIQCDSERTKQILKVLTKPFKISD